MIQPLFVSSPSAKFRGSRRYVHSTDIYIGALQALEKASLPITGPVDLRFNREMTTRPEYQVYSGGRRIDGATGAICTFGAEGPVTSVCVVPTPEAIVDVREYDESPTVRCGGVSGRVAWLNEDTGMHPVETLTSLAVHLHKSVFPPPAERRWMLARLSIARVLQPQDSSQIGLQLERILRGSFTRTMVTSFDGYIGTLDFALARTR